MKVTRILLAVLTFTAILGSMVVIFAQNKGEGGPARFGFQGRGQRPDGPPMGPPGGPGGRIFEQLSLTDEQKMQIKTLHENARTASEKYFTQMKEVQEQLRTLTRAATFNEEQARQVLAAKAQIETELELIRLRTDAAVYNVLTAEQKAQLTQLEKQRPEPPPGEGFRPGPPPPPPQP